jgi:hypothetical protein
MTKSEVIGYYKGFELHKSEYREERHPQYNYLGYSAIRGKYYIQVKYTDLEIRTIPIEILFLKFIQHLDRFISENINGITNEVH